MSFLSIDTHEKTTWHHISRCYCCTFTTQALFIPEKGQYFIFVMSLPTWISFWLTPSVLRDLNPCECILHSPNEFDWSPAKSQQDLYSNLDCCVRATPPLHWQRSDDFNNSSNAESILTEWNYWFGNPSTDEQHLLQGACCRVPPPSRWLRHVTTSSDLSDEELWISTRRDREFCVFFRNDEGLDVVLEERWIWFIFRILLA